MITSYLLETALKSVLKSNATLAGKTILITLLPLKKHWKVIFFQDDVYCYDISDNEKDTATANLTISATPQALMAMLIRGERTGLKLEGDVVLAQALEHCLNECPSFVQEKLEDTSFYPITALFKKGCEKIQKLCSKSQRTLADYLQEETDCLPLPSEVKIFCDEVDELKLRVDRIEAHMYSEQIS